MKAEQTSIGGARDTKPDPSKFDCEWCTPTRTATVAVERQTKIKGQRGATMGTGQYIMACSLHEQTAKELASAG